MASKKTRAAAQKLVEKLLKKKTHLGVPEVPREEFLECEYDNYKEIAQTLAEKIVCLTEYLEATQEECDQLQEKYDNLCDEI